MKEHYDFCIIDLKTNEVVLYDSPKAHNFSAMNDEVVLDVKVSFDNNNNLVIEGDPLYFEVAMERLNIDDISEDKKPCKKYIKTYTPGKLARFFGTKPYDYVYGWWGYRGETPIKYVMNNYRIKLI